MLIPSLDDIVLILEAGQDHEGDVGARIGSVDHCDPIGDFLWARLAGEHILEDRHHPIGVVVTDPALVEIFCRAEDSGHDFFILRAGAECRQAVCQITAGRATEEFLKPTLYQEGAVFGGSQEEGRVLFPRVGGQEVQAAEMETKPIHYVIGCMQISREHRNWILSLFDRVWLIQFSAALCRAHMLAELRELRSLRFGAQITRRGLVVDAGQRRRSTKIECRGWGRFGRPYAGRRVNQRATKIGC
jgi:hypothetical protein